MRLLLIANLLILSVGTGNSFRVTEFLDPNTNQPARQSEEGNQLEDQIGPIFIVTLAAATIWNLITMGQTSTEISSNGKHFLEFIHRKQQSNLKTYGY